MRKRKEIKDKTRNNRFVEAFDYLRRNTDITKRIQLAAKMGVSNDTITRIMHAYTPFTEEAITKFQTATGCIFNLQWLRGESDIMFANDVEKKSAPAAEIPHHSAPTIDQGSLMNATIAAQQTSIESLKRELADKEENTRRALADKEESTRRELARMEASTKRELAAKDETISALRGQLATKDAQLKDKDAYIQSLKQQVADLRSTLALRQVQDSIDNFPFTIGAAENSRQQPQK